MVALVALSASFLLLLISLRWPRVILYVLFLLLPTQWIFVEFSQFHLSPADVVLVIAVGAFCVRLLLLNHSSLVAVWHHRYLGLALVTYSFGLIESGVFPMTFIRLGFAMAISMLACEVLSDRQSLLRAGQALIGGALIAVVYGIVLFWIETPRASGRFESFGNPNYTALYMFSASLISAMCFFGRRSPLFAAISIVLLVLGMLTLSQTAIVAFGVAGLVGLLIIRNVPLRVQLLAIMLVVLGIGICEGTILEVVQDRNAEVLQIDQKARSSWDIRLLILEDAWGRFLEGPLLGIGYGRSTIESINDVEIYRLSGGGGYGTHNTYLEILVEGGLVTFFFMSLHVFRVIRGWQPLHTAVFERQDWIIASCMIGVPFVLVAALGMNLLLIYSFWGVCGLGLAGIIQAQRRSESRIGTESSKMEESGRTVVSSSEDRMTY